MSIALAFPLICPGKCLLEELCAVQQTVVYMSPHMATWSEHELLDCVVFVPFVYTIVTLFGCDLGLRLLVLVPDPTNPSTDRF